MASGGGAGAVVEEDMNFNTFLPATAGRMWPRVCCSSGATARALPATHDATKSIARSTEKFEREKLFEV